MSRLSSIILAGGKSKRMGEDKRFLPIEGRTLLEQSIHLASKFSEDLIISANDEPRKLEAYKLIKDTIPSAGPLSGIISCLSEIKNSHAIILSCDMPFLDENSLRYLLQKMNPDFLSSFAAPDHFYPFPAIIPKSLLSILEEEYEAGHHSLRKVYQRIPYHPVSVPPQILKKVFLNVNRPEDYQQLFS